MGYLLHQLVQDFWTINSPPNAFRPHDPYAARMNSCCDRVSHRIRKHPGFQRVSQRVSKHPPKEVVSSCSKKLTHGMFTVLKNPAGGFLPTWKSHRMKIPGKKHLRIQAGSCMGKLAKDSISYIISMAWKASADGKLGWKSSYASSGPQWRSMTKILVKHHGSLSISWISILKNMCTWLAKSPIRIINQILPSLNPTVRTWKWMVGRLFPFLLGFGLSWGACCLFQGGVIFEVMLEVS